MYSILSVLVLVLVGTSVNCSDRFIDKRPPATTSTATLEPWPRTRSGKFELVTPVVIDGITFSASPRSNYKTPPPWVSLKKDGRPKTIKPKIKGGDIKNDWPDYDTYFDSVMTKTHDLYKAIEGHSGDRYYKEHKLIPEDKEDKYLNPLIRCTPDRYFNRKGGKKNSDPFCTPTQNSQVLLGQIHWVTWYTRHFDNPDDKVRLHMAYIEDTGEPIQKRQIGGNAQFFTSEWMENDGFYPLEIEEEWLLEKYEQLVVMAIQPESMADSEVDLLDIGTILKIRRGPTVMKDSEQEKIKVKPLSEDGIIMALLSIPTVILFFALCYMLFVYCTKDARGINTHELRELSKHRKKHGHSKAHKYSKLPTHTGDLKQN